MKVLKIHNLDNHVPLKSLDIKIEKKKVKKYEFRGQNTSNIQQNIYRTDNACLIFFAVYLISFFV